MFFNSSDRLMISSLRGSTETALYSLAYSLSAIILLIWNAVNNSLTPFVMDKYESKKYDEVSKVVYPIIVVFGSICFLIILFAPEILCILGTKEYKAAVYVIPPIIGGVFFQSWYFVFTDLLYFYRKQKYVMIASICSAMLNIILNYLLIPVLGFIAAGYTTLVCYALQALVDYFVAEYVIHVSIIKSKQLVLLFGGMICCIILSEFLYTNTTFRFISVGIIAIFFIINRKMILKIIRIQ
ncbi:MATE family efflux transporter [Lachnospiraceae bacterium 62-35]